MWWWRSGFDPAAGEIPMRQTHIRPCQLRDVVASVSLLRLISDPGLWGPPKIWYDERGRSESVDREGGKRCSSDDEVEEEEE